MKETIGDNKYNQECYPEKSITISQSILDRM